MLNSKNSFILSIIIFVYIIINKFLIKRDFSLIEGLLVFIISIFILKLFDFLSSKNNNNSR